MSEIDSITSMQWMQYYQQETSEFPVANANFSDSAIATEPMFSPDQIIPSGICVTDTMLSGENSPVGSCDLSPKSGIVKPKQRRSRASKKTPTTLLNANATNFRALVQQYTGCQTAPSSSRKQKGPINLCFGTSNNEQNGLFATSQQSQYYYYGESQNQEQESRFSSGENNNTDVPFSSFSSAEHGMLNADEFGWG